MAGISDHFSQSELQELCRRSDWLGWITVINHWLIVASAFVLVALLPNILTIALAMIVIGGRQLGCGALMHECGHGTLFASKRLNQIVGKWLAAAPMLFRIDDYMTSHLKHHRLIGTPEDPDLHRYQRYPTSARNLRKKLWRDMTGRTSWKNLVISMRDNKILQIDNKGNQVFSFIQLFTRWHAPIITNLLMLSILALCGYPWLYLLWIASYFSTFMVCSRVRNLAEHAATPDLTSLNPINNTRTTVASWWERLMFAPNCVNYHLEHHLMPTVPKYRLVDFHRALKNKGLLKEADICYGYGEVIRKLIEPTAA